MRRTTACSCAAWRRAASAAGLSTGTRALSANCCRHAGFDLVLVETVGIGQEDCRSRAGWWTRQILVMSPDYGSRLQLQKIVMLDVADIVVVNKSDLAGAKTALRGNRATPGLKRTRPEAHRHGRQAPSGSRRG